MTFTDTNAFIRPYLLIRKVILYKVNIMKIVKNIAVFSICTGLILASCGCAYTHIQRPLDRNFDTTQLGVKEGRSHAYSLFWAVAWGDAGTKAAARQGEITTIRHADTEVKSVCLGLYTRVTTVVYGD